MVESGGVEGNGVLDDSDPLPFAGLSGYCGLPSDADIGVLVAPLQLFKPSLYRPTDGFGGGLAPGI